MAGKHPRTTDLRTVEPDDILSGATGDTSGGRQGSRRSWRLARALMIVGGALAWLAGILPWMIAQEAPFYDSHILYAAVLPNPMLTVLAGLAHGGHSEVAIVLTAEQAYTALGAFIGCALLAELSSRLRAALVLSHAVWLATLLVWLTIVLALLGAHSTAALINVLPGMRLIGVAPAGGFWLAWLAAALSVAGALLARGTLRQSAATALDAHSAASTFDAKGLLLRSARERWGIAIATAGVLIWGCGFFALPWVTQGCAGLHFAPTHFVSGTCAGLAAADALTLSPLGRLSSVVAFAPGSGVPANESLPSSIDILPYNQPTQSALTNDAFIYLLLAALACWALLQMWAGSGGVRRYGWALAWLALACLIAALAFQGTQVALANPTILDLRITDAWVLGPGLAFALAGLALAAGGITWALAAAFANET